MTMAKNKHERVFPKVLHRLLQAASVEGWEDIVSWNANGTSFKIHDRDKFLNVLAAHGMKQSHYKSFVRQLNLWGFQCIHGGKKNAERGSYHHECFLRDNPAKIEDMSRVKVKGKCVRRSKAGGVPMEIVVAYSADQATSKTVDELTDFGEEEDNESGSSPSVEEEAFEVVYTEQEDEPVSDHSGVEDQPVDEYVLDDDFAFFEYLDAQQWVDDEVVQKRKDTDPIMAEWLECAPLDMIE